MSNEGGRDMLLSNQAIHKYQVTKMKPQVDTRPPKTFKQKPIALQKRSAKKPQNPDPSIIYSI
jgi:hypothetical protein